MWWCCVKEVVEGYWRIKFFNFHLEEEVFISDTETDADRVENIALWQHFML
jgi:hypothetical protein